VLELVRVRIGPIKVCNMKPGEFRELTDAEVAELKSVKTHRA
jgi:16S rRNA U516 pseudouridylate synthase RsuA-like enzyme